MPGLAGRFVHMTFFNLPCHFHRWALPGCQSSESLINLSMVTQGLGIGGEETRSQVRLTVFITWCVSKSGLVSESSGTFVKKETRARPHPRLMECMEPDVLGGSSQEGKQT